VKHQQHASLLSSAMVSTMVAALALVSLAAFAADKGSKDKPVYKWTDDKGVVHYGDSIPAQYSKQDRRVLNEQGVEVGRLEAEKTEAQRADEEQRSRAIASSKQRDQVLLTTYVSEQQIEQLRDQRLDLIEGQVQVTSQYLDTLNTRLDNLQTQAQFFKPYSSNAGAKPMPDHLAEDLVRTLNEIRVQQRNLASKRREQSDVRDRFAADISRFRELRSGRR
jgi:hypothetical protein